MSMYPHTVTLWCRMGGSGREEAWTRTVLEGVRFDAEAGTSRSPGGDRSASSAMLLVPAAAMEGYVPPARFVGEGWTLRPRDMVAEGDVAGDGPSADAVGVASVKAVRVGSGIHHLEARR